MALFAALYVTESVVLETWASGSLSAGIKSVPLPLIACAFSLVALPAYGLYVALAFTPYFPKVRGALAALTLVGSSVSVLIFTKSEVRPEIGWYVWMLSILLALAPEVLWSVRFLMGKEEATSEKPV